MKKLNLLKLILLILITTACLSSSKNKNALSIEKKVDTILSQMTLAEKVGQMTQVDLRMLDELSDIKT